MTRFNEVRFLWCATVAAMVASWTHLASWIASWEYAGASSWIIGCVAATAVDLGILAAMRSQDKLASMSQPTTGPRRTVYFLAAVSMVANVAHALDARMTRVGPTDGTWQGDAWRIAGAVVVAGVLPLIVIRLSHLLDTVTQAIAPAAIPAPTVVASPPAPRRAVRRRPVTRPAPDASAPVGGEVASQVRQAVTHAAPGASMRQLAKAAGVSDASVRRLVSAGTLARDDDGWRMVA